MAIDFFTVETVRLTTLYVLFAIELHTRQVRLVGVTDHPNELWVVQRAREFSMNRERGSGGVTSAPRFLVRDRDSTFTRAFDDVLASDGIQTITTPIQAPNANAFAERWVRTVRQECLERLRLLPAFGAGTDSAVSSTSITWSRHDAPVSEPNG
jgi:putative transposase